MFIACGPRHVVVRSPGAVVLVPLPDRAVEGRLGVHLELMHVELVGAQELRRRLDQARMPRQALEDRVPGLHVEGRARRFGALLAHHFRPLLAEHRRQLGIEEGYLRRGETAGQEQVALLLEFGDLGRGQLHGGLPARHQSLGRLSLGRL